MHAYRDRARYVGNWIVTHMNSLVGSDLKCSESNVEYFRLGFAKS